MIVYGIKNCDTVKKALTWLNENKIDFEFHDYKMKGISEKKLKEWSAALGWEALVNKKGMTWRQLDDKIKESITDEKAAIKLMIEKTSVIKRPLIEIQGKAVLIGFSENDFSKKLR
jgi:arsenate reductase (glutaredoxin)